MIQGAVFRVLQKEEGFELVTEIEKNQRIPQIPIPLLKFKIFRQQSSFTLSPLHKILETLTNIFYNKFVDFFYRRVTQNQTKSESTNQLHFKKAQENLGSGILRHAYFLYWRYNSG
jgi:hypothetical protein